MAKGVDGVYDADPRTNPDAVRFDALTYAEVLAPRPARSPTPPRSACAGTTSCRSSCSTCSPRATSPGPSGVRRSARSWRRALSRLSRRPAIARSRQRQGDAGDRRHPPRGRGEDGEGGRGRARGLRRRSAPAGPTRRCSPRSRSTTTARRRRSSSWPSFHVPDAAHGRRSPRTTRARWRAIEKAIRDTDLGVNPTNDGTVIRVVFPQLTEERRREYVKVAKHQGRGRPGRRSATSAGTRRTPLDKLAKDGEAGEDDVRRAEKELEELTHKYVAQSTSCSSTRKPSCSRSEPMTQPADVTSAARSDAGRATRRAHRRARRRNLVAAVGGRACCSVRSSWSRSTGSRAASSPSSPSRSSSRSPSWSRALIRGRHHAATAAARSAAPSRWSCARTRGGLPGLAVAYAATVLVLVFWRLRRRAVAAPCATSRPACGRRRTCRSSAASRC